VVKYKYFHHFQCDSVLNLVKIDAQFIFGEKGKKLFLVKTLKKFQAHVVAKCGKIRWRWFICKNCLLFPLVLTIIINWNVSLKV
jgi:hypothetical protein